MGNLCNGKNERQPSDTIDTLNKNYSFAQFLLKNLCTLEIVSGTYRCHRGETLLVFVQQEYLQYCCELRDYAHNFNSVLDMVNSERRKVMNVGVNRACPYKKIQLCVLSPYKSDDSQTYFQQFRNMSKQILKSSSDITIQINHTAEKSNGIPNQMLLAVFLQSICENIDKPIKITMVSSEMRFEVVKMQDYVGMNSNDRNKN